MYARVRARGLPRAAPPPLPSRALPNSSRGEPCQLLNRRRLTSRTAHAASAVSAKINLRGGFSVPKNGEAVNASSGLICEETRFEDRIAEAGVAANFVADTFGVLEVVHRRVSSAPEPPAVGVTCRLRFIARLATLQQCDHSVEGGDRGHARFGCVCFHSPIAVDEVWLPTYSKLEREPFRQVDGDEIPRFNRGQRYAHSYLHILLSPD